MDTHFGDGREETDSGHAILLDTSAFIMGYEPSDVDAEHYTVPAVLEELRRDRLSQLRIEAALRTGRLKAFSPESLYVKEAEAAAAELGETDVLSHADKMLLALGLQLKEGGRDPVIVSDDYSVQNVADRLGLRYTSLATRGIRRVFDWAIYCPGCRRVFSGLQPDGACPVCGTALRRRPVRKTPARGRKGSSGPEAAHEGA